MNKERLYERLEMFKKASQKLDEATHLELKEDIIIDGVIQRFEFTFELSWKLMKTFLEYTGITDIKSPWGAIKEAFTFGLINDGEKWIDMLIVRNKPSHIYDEEEARLIYEKIKNMYNKLFLDFYHSIEGKIKKIRLKKVPHHTEPFLV